MFVAGLSLSSDRRPEQARSDIGSVGEYPRLALYLWERACSGRRSDDSGGSVNEEGGCDGLSRAGSLPQWTSGVDRIQGWLGT